MVNIPGIRDSEQFLHKSYYTNEGKENSFEIADVNSNSEDKVHCTYDSLTRYRV